MKTDQTIRILLIIGEEDSKTISKLLSPVDNCVFESMTVRTVKAALKQIGIHRPEVILLELGIEGAQDTDALVKLHQSAIDIPIIAIAGADQEKLATAAASAGAHDFLLKSELTARLLAKAIRYAAQRNKSESELRDSEARFRTIFEQGPAGIFLATIDEHIFQANSSLCRLLEYTEAELIGRTISDITYGPDLQDIGGTAQQLAQDGHPGIIEKRYIKKNGQPIWVHVTANLVHDAGGNALYGINIVEDISERKKAELSFGLEQREDFMATLTHDLKTPIVGANMVLGALIDGSLGPLNPMQEEIIGKLKTSNQALLKMIQNLLEVYRYEAGTEALYLKQIEISPLVQFCLDEVKPLADSKAQKLLAHLPETHCALQADEDALKRVLINVLGNAVKFTPERGTIEVEVERKDPNVIMRVKDTGMGISDQDQERLFQRFWQSDPGKRYAVGTGLGLYFCHRVLEAHHGKITCQSEPGRGTTFTIILPAR